jgi:hypothetical protein
MRGTLITVRQVTANASLGTSNVAFISAPPVSKQYSSICRRRQSAAAAAESAARMVSARAAESQLTTAQTDAAAARHGRCSAVWRTVASRLHCLNCCQHDR